jgi:hypothetical protein
VVRDAVERAVLGEAGEHAVRRRDERGQRVVAEVIDGARGFDLFGRCAVQQQFVADVGSDDVVDQRAHVPLGAGRGSSPVVGSEESQPPCEPVVGHDEQLERISRPGHTRIVAPPTTGRPRRRRTT